MIFESSLTYNTKKFIGSISLFLSSLHLKCYVFSSNLHEIQFFLETPFISIGIQIYSTFSKGIEAKLDVIAILTVYGVYIYIRNIEWIGWKEP